MQKKAGKKSKWPLSGAQAASRVSLCLNRTKSKMLVCFTLSTFISSAQHTTNQYTNMNAHNLNDLLQLGSSSRAIHGGVYFRFRTKIQSDNCFETASTPGMLLEGCNVVSTCHVRSTCNVVITCCNVVSTCNVIHKHLQHTVWCV